MQTIVVLFCISINHVTNAHNSTSTNTSKVEEKVLTPNNVHTCTVDSTVKHNFTVTHIKQKQVLLINDC